MIADLPGGVRVELLADREQSTPIAFHHAHLSAVDGVALRDWYVRVFGAEPSERRNLPSSVVPGGRVDFLPVRGAAPRPSRGAAIDHIGFEAQELEALARRHRCYALDFWGFGDSDKSRINCTVSDYLSASLPGTLGVFEHHCVEASTRKNRV